MLSLVLLLLLLFFFFFASTTVKALDECVQITYAVYIARSKPCLSHHKNTSRQMKVSIFIYYSVLQNKRRWAAGYVVFIQFYIAINVSQI